MQIKLSSSMIQFAKVSVGDMKKPIEPINRKDKNEQNKTKPRVPKQDR